MILVDSSIWMNHFRAINQRLFDLLDADLVSSHPWIVGEIACGNLARRESVISSLKALPQITVATDNEVLHFIDKHQIAGKGLGYVDMHLLASAAIAREKVWTADRRMTEVASLLGLNASITG
jgi:predicted nucleic acid-binding protein